MVRGKTQKRRTSKKESKKVLSIPELRSSMEYMTSCSQKLAHSKMSTKEAAKHFASEWKKVFGKTLAPKVAEDYIKHMMRSKRHTRKHRGGSAPLDYMTRPGANLPYGNFQEYVKGGFVTPQPGVLTDIGLKQGVTPQPGMGSNKMSGGSILGSISSGMSAILTRPFVGVNPESSQHALMSSWKGLPPSPGGASYQQNWPYISQASMSPYPVPQIYTRTLSQQGQIA